MFLLTLNLGNYDLRIQESQQPRIQSCIRTFAPPKHLSGINGAVEDDTPLLKDLLRLHQKSNSTIIVSHLIFLGISLQMCLEVHYPIHL